MDPRATPAGPSPAGLLLPAVVHGLGSVGWQKALRRTGMPFRSPADDPARSALALLGAAAGGVLATAGAGAAVAAVTGVPPPAARRTAWAWCCRRSCPSRSWARPGAPWPRRPLVRRWARAGADDPTLVAARTGVGIALFGLVHATLTSAVEQLLDALLPPPPRPAGPPPATRLNVVGPDVGDTGHGPEGFVVYLDGVGRYERRTTPVGRAFADAVAERLPRWSVVLSLMPNDVTQEPAWQRPVTGRLWRRLHRGEPDDRAGPRGVGGGRGHRPPLPRPARPGAHPPGRRPPARRGLRGRQRRPRRARRPQRRRPDRAARRLRRGAVPRAARRSTW